MPDELEVLRAVARLGAEVDELVETSMRNRASLARTMGAVLPVIARATAARAVVVRTFGEDLGLQTFAHPAGFTHAAVDRFFADSEADPALGGELPAGDDVLVAQAFDVAGEWFGSAALVIEKDRAGDTALAAALLRAACEQLDNYLFSIFAARRKQRTTLALVAALRAPVLGEGLERAAALLSSEIPMTRLLLVVASEDDEHAPVHVQVYEGARLAKCTLREADDTVDEMAQRYLAGGDRALADAFGFEHAREEVLIHGTRERPVGKLLVASASGDFDTHDRDLLASFASFICQRVVDFNKEHRTLSRSFRHADAARILRHADYAERFLAPREAEVAMMYVDISGFTRVSEQVLRDPRAIGHLVDAWGGRAVELVWKHGGTFDKMVGDCVIGLFGPPFYDTTPHERVAAAIRAAVEIRAMTEALGEVPGLEKLKDVGMSVSTGVSFGPLFVGRFGPNDNFTGFSASMNNTARLQGQAARGEILVMQVAVDALEGDRAFSFGEPREAKVKNVADALRFRALLPG